MKKKIKNSQPQTKFTGSYLKKECICLNIQKQPSRGVPKKKFSENMQQIYTRTPMLKFVLLQVCYISSEHLFQRTPLDGCFWIYMFPQIANFFFQNSMKDRRTHFNISFTSGRRRDNKLNFFEINYEKKEGGYHLILNIILYCYIDIKLYH